MESLNNALEPCEWEKAYKGEVRSILVLFSLFPSSSLNFASFPGVSHPLLFFVSFFVLPATWALQPIARFTRESPDVPVFAISFYLVFVFLVPKWIENRPPFPIRKLVAFWNLFLAVFRSVQSIFQGFYPAGKEGLRTEPERE